MLKPKDLSLHKTEAQILDSKSDELDGKSLLPYSVVGAMNCSGALESAVAVDILPETDVVYTDADLLRSSGTDK